MLEPVIMPTDIVQRTILVVDDIPSVRFYHTYILRKDGFKCVVAHDGLEALQRLTEGPVDLVMVDIVMPNVNGLEFIKRIRDNPAFAKLPVLVITSEAIGEQVRQERTVSTGPVGYAQKPLSPSTVIEEIHRLLGEG